MATETTAETTETESTATETTEATATETEQVTAPEATKPETSPKEIQLPEDHPLVKTLAAQKEELAKLRPSGAKVTDLEKQISELTPKAEATEQVQLKYDRLEAFLTKVGGPLSKALDSRSFTKALFESDEDIDAIVTQWHKDNPSATSSALQSGPGTTKASNSMNDLLRSAAQAQ